MFFNQNEVNYGMSQMALSIDTTILSSYCYTLSCSTETVVGEAVVVIKKLIQLQPKEHKDLIVHVAKLVDTVTVSVVQ